MNIRKITTRPGFELIFAAGIAAIFIVPSAVMAQANKNVEISITNGDTVINGKNIKDLNARERRDALNDLEKITGPKGGHKMLRFDRRIEGDVNTGGDLGNSNLNIVKTPDGFIVEGLNDGRSKPLHLKKRLTDSITTHSFTFRLTRPDPMMDEMPKRDNRELRIERPGGDGDFNFDGPRAGGRMGMGFNRRNSQTFSYTNTDGQGISTHVNFRVTERNERIMGITGTEKGGLDITDLKLVPDFTSGKTLLMFDLPSKGSAEVQFSDDNGKVLWSEKWTAQTFTKSFPLPLNGMYQLKVKQGGKTAVKQILKEE